MKYPPINWEGLVITWVVANALLAAMLVALA